MTKRYKPDREIQAQQRDTSLRRRHVQLAGWSGTSHVMNGKGSSIASYTIVHFYGQCFFVMEFAIQKSATFKVS